MMAGDYAPGRFSYAGLLKGRRARLNSTLVDQNEPINFCPEWSHQFILFAMIQVISDHLSSSGSSQRNPLNWPPSK